MIRLENIHNFYFIGIGGIGMSALALYWHNKGKNVCGYDRTPSEITEKLTDLGIEVIFTDDFEQVPSDWETENTLVVYTPAIPTDNQIFTGFKNRNFTLIKRAQLLGEVSKNTKCLAVAGTHGKTTTSSILAHLLIQSEVSVTAFLGGIAENYHSNFVDNGSEYTVLEADEFDRSFLQLQPYIAGITSMDADHLDIYGDATEVTNAFKDFAHLVADKTHLLHQKGLPLGGKSVAVEDEADYAAINVRMINGHYHFDLKTPQGIIPDFIFKLPGKHNLFNATMALGMALISGSPQHKLAGALESFQGVQRRFTYRIDKPNLVLIDDYAHHPEEINAVYQAVSEKYPEDSKLVIFQPHLFSRTRDFGGAFAESLSHFDEIALLEIYPAREKPLPGISSQWLLNQINHPYKQLISKPDLVDCIKNSSCRVVIMMGAGDIGVEIERVTKELTV